jgi:hypothetical protein
MVATHPDSSIGNYTDDRRCLAPDKDSVRAHAPHKDVVGGDYAALICNRSRRIPADSGRLLRAYIQYRQMVVKGHVLSAGSDTDSLIFSNNTVSASAQQYHNNDIETRGGFKWIE